MSRIVGAQAVIIDDSRRVLLQLRPWPPGWEPPGGHVGADEDPAETAVRETREECGLEIAIERPTGTYHFRGIRVGADQVFRAHVVGGAPRRTKEALALAWVTTEQLPRALFPWYRQRILDAMAPLGQAPFERWQSVDLGHVMRHGAALTAELGGVVGTRLGQLRSP
ncbi:MAG: NUDIX hydrolase [Candidatus Dormibacteria bacterium]